MSNETAARPRRTTLECFNEELAILDRPLENDVAYYDDPPPPSPWRWAGGIMGAALFFGAAVGVLLTRQPSAAQASAQESVPIQLPAAAIQASGPSVMPEEPAPKVATPEPTTEASADVPADTQSFARKAPASKAAWAKVVGRTIRRR